MIIGKSSKVDGWQHHNYFPFLSDEGQKKLLFERWNSSIFQETRQTVQDRRAVFTFDYLPLLLLLNQSFESKAIPVELVCSVSSLFIVECSSEKRKRQKYSRRLTKSFFSPLRLPFLSVFLSLCVPQCINSLLQTSQFYCSPFYLLQVEASFCWRS